MALEPFTVYRVLKNMYDPNVSLQCSLFDKLVHPVIDYGSGCEVWGFHKAPAVEKLYLQYCKRIFHVKRSTANFFVYGELGRYPMYIGRFVKIIKFWIKIILGKASPFVKVIIYCIMIHECEINGAENWAFGVRLLQNILV